MPSPALITLLFIGLFSVSLVACSNDPIPPIDLLLASEDFPTEVIVEIAKEHGTTNNDEPTVQVGLKAQGFTILESLVLSETRKLALAILAGINQDHAALGIVSASVEGFDDSSGIIVERLAGEQTSTVFLLKDGPS